MKTQRERDSQGLLVVSRHKPFEAAWCLPRDYQFVWGKPPVCPVCRQPIEGGQMVVWYSREGRREIMHVACGGEKA
jgi:hypothetical protein